MADISDIDAAQSVKLVGSSSDGTEQTPVNSTDLGQIKTSDTIDQQGEDTVLSLTTTAVIARVGGSNKTNRSYVFLQALDNNVKWGFDTNCRFDAFRNQIITIPASSSCDIYVKADSGTPDVVVGEG